MGLVTQTALPQWTGQGFEEYLLIVRPDAAMQQKILIAQQYLLKEHEWKEGVKYNAFIPVAQFELREGMEETLTRWLQRICNQQHSFEVTFNNYSGIPPHTIYLRVQDHQPFQQLIKQLQPIDEYIRSSACPPARLTQRPHLSIAGHLPEALYEKAMPFYARRSFHESFTVQELLLVKKDLLTGSFKTVNVFRLMPSEFGSKREQE